MLQVDLTTVCSYVGIVLAIVALWWMTCYQKDLKKFAEIISDDMNKIRSEEDNLLRHVQKLMAEISDSHMRQNEIENRITAMEEGEER